MGHSSSPDSPSLRCVAGVCYPLAVGAVCGCGGPHSPLCAGPCGHYAQWSAWVFIGTFSSALVRCVLCALPGYAAPVGCWCLEPVPVPSLRPAVCLSGVSRGPALVRRPSSGPASLSAAVCFPVVLVPSPNGGFCPKLYWAAARGTWRSAGNRDHGACHWPLPRGGRWARSASYSFGAPLWGCPRQVPPMLVLGCVRCGGFALLGPDAHTSGFPYRPSVNGVLGSCNGAVSCGRWLLFFLVGGRQAWVPRLFACVCSSWPGSVRPASWVHFGARHLSCRIFGLLLCSAPSELGLPFDCPFVCLLSCPCLSFLSLVPRCLRPRCFRLPVVSGPGCPRPWRSVCSSARDPALTPNLFFLFSALRPVVSGVLFFPASGVLGLVPPLFSFSFSPFFFCYFLLPPPSPLGVCFFGSGLLVAGLSLFSCCFGVFCLVFGCSLAVAAPSCCPPPPLEVCRGCHPRAARFSVSSLCFLVPSCLLGSRRLSLPPPIRWCVRCALSCWVLPRCAGLLFGVSRCCVAAFCAVEGCGALCGVLWGGFLSVLPCCAMLLLAAVCFTASLVVFPAALFALWLAVSSWSALPCAVLCPWLPCCVVLLRVVPRGTVLLCAGFFRLALCGAAACCVAPLGFVLRPGLLFFRALCFVVFLCSVCFVMLLVRCCALCCGCPGVSCCAFSVLSALCGAALRCAGALASCCLIGLCCLCCPVPWRVAVCCDFSFWCSVLQCCAALCVVCCAAACYALFCCVLSCCVADFGAGVPVWRVAGCPAVWCGFLCGPALPWCPVPCAVPWGAVLRDGSVLSCRLL